MWDKNRFLAAKAAMVICAAIFMAGSANAQFVSVGSVPANFVDISGTGTPELLGDDEVTAPIPIGFNFPFFGTSQTDYLISSNGFISFDPGVGSDFSNDCPPIAGTSPDLALFAYWDDLDPADDGAAVFHQTFGDCPVDAPTGRGACFIVQYEEFDFFPGDGVAGGTAGTFQSVAYENGTVLYQYQAGSPGLDGASATIAASLDNIDPNIDLFACDTAGSIAPGDAIQFGVDVLPDAPAVPTMSAWGLIAMAMVLMLVGSLMIRRVKS